MFLPAFQPIIEHTCLSFIWIILHGVCYTEFSLLSVWFLFQTHYTVPDTEKDLQSLIATIECEQPQPDLYKYELILCVATHAGTNSVH